MIEHIEPRWLLSAMITSGVLKVSGTPSADMIILTQDASFIHVKINGQEMLPAFAVGDVNTISVDTGSGDDVVTLQKSVSQSAGRVSKPATITGGPGNDTLVGGSGNDMISGGAGNDV